MKAPEHNTAFQGRQGTGRDRTGWDNTSDEDLALALQNGQEAAFDEMVRRHQGRVFAVAFRMTGHREDALDVAQEVFLKAYRKIDAWQPSGGFVAWLLRLTTNQSIDHLRRKKRHRHERFDETFRPEGGPAVNEPMTDDTAVRVRGGEIADRVNEALEVLSPSQRTVFVLRHYEGLPLADIAPVLGCTVGSVKVHLFRALKKLQKELGDLRD
ncbi:MAG: sigma-70 family RNA polymerase sigma factor [Candidatus Hydrogenedentales bacterium]